MDVVVLGDALLDVDLDGDARRLAPDAPVPVVEDPAVRVRAGGAGLAATMLARDGYVVTLCTALGNDATARRLRGVLEAAGVRVLDIAGRGTTPRKTRIRAAGHCLARIDTGSTPLTPVRRSVKAAARCIGSAGAVLVADYGQGVAGHDELRRAMRPRGGQFVVWDPHPRGAEPLAYTHLVTPNEREAAARAGCETSFPAGAAEAAPRLRSAWAVRGVAVTCGSRGAVLATGDAVPLAVPVASAADGDPCGAGDRFAAVALAALASGATASDAVRDAVDASAAFVHHHELAGLSLESARPGAPTRTIVATSGCFDLLHPGHVSTLRAARALGDQLVVLLNSDSSVRRLKGPGRPVVRQADRAALLRELACVDDVVVFDQDTPAAMLRRLHPDIFVKGGDYDAATLPETEVMAEWNGRVVVVPYLRGCSTTRIIEEARNERFRSTS
jgi:rfaE bifunctional protein nucleotidyltransferase chain/domain/rfaE bifunctional protein kinase chain/domain